MPIVLAYGTDESPEFQRQARDFAAALTAAGKRVQLLAGEGYNHFEIAETLVTRTAWPVAPRSSKCT